MILMLMQEKLQDNNLYNAGAACGPCSVAQANAGVVNVTGVQEKVGGNGRRYSKEK